MGALAGEDCRVIAHVGGLYDLNYAHDRRTERSVAVHSSWGTFERLLHDAFEQGYLVGVVCHSDDHKGRPGATRPGASSFGAVGGLTCYLLRELSRDAVFNNDNYQLAPAGSVDLILTVRSYHDRMSSGCATLRSRPFSGPSGRIRARHILRDEWQSPRDTKDYTRGVWTLPPTFALGAQDREKYAAIGEGDNFVL